MEPSCWGIKLKPMIKKIHTDDSKYYLEIIPEVSCLKNFDKIEWKHENMFYEYVIPMAYKVIVRRDRKNIVRDSIDSLDPMYHSCVDLLHPSATDTVWGSGDINRILSDTFIVSKVTDIESCNIVMPKNVKIDSVCNLKNTIPKSMQTIEEREGFTLTQYKNEETCTATKSTVQVEEIQDTPLDDQVNYDTEENLVEKKGTYTSQYAFPPISVGLSDIKLLDDLSDDLINVEQEILPERKRGEYIQKLSLSPICSVIVNTEPELTTPPDMNENVSLISYDAIINSHDLRSYKPFFSMYNVNTDRMKKDDNLQPRSNVCIDSLGRTAPGGRIQYYLNLLRKEILPLNVMLDDILTKYAALNISVNDFVTTDVDKKPFKSFKMLENKKVIEEQTKCEKSNRVVYTIVFDG